MESVMFPALLQPSAVLMTMPRISPMAQPVRQCRVAETAAPVSCRDVMDVLMAVGSSRVVPRLYPGGVLHKRWWRGLQWRSWVVASGSARRAGAGGTAGRRGAGG